VPDEEEVGELTVERKSDIGGKTYIELPARQFVSGSTVPNF